VSARFARAVSKAPGKLSVLDLELRTGFILNDQRRIVSTREPQASRGPLFTMIRSASQCVWAVREDVPNELAAEIDGLACEEPPAGDLRAAPVHAAKYISLLGGRPAFSGPAFTFPDVLPATAGVALVEDERLLQRNFQGWEAGEIAAGRGPALAVIEDGYAVSVCFCARRSDTAAAAGLQTAEAFRNRGLGERVTAAWASAIRATGRIPLYSAAWTNQASRAVARKLGLAAYASYWSLSE
jgi:hypothetical protein